MQDANYNVVALFDNSGTVVERYAYDPFGQVTALDAGWNTLAGSAFGWVYLHQGGRFDTTSSLYHFRHRDYSPTLGRWTSLDPIRYAAGDVNLYRALGNSPVNTVDPSGLDWWYPGKHLYRYYREWRRGRELDAKLDEVRRRNHDPVAAVMQSRDGQWSVRSGYGLADPAFERNWRQGLGDVAVLANVGVQWMASGPMWVSPSGQTFVWTSGRWWNSTANRAANAQEAAAANRAVAAARSPFNNGGVLNAANYAQTSYPSTFSAEGIRIYSRLAGRPINTIDDLVGAIRAGHINPSQIEVNYIVRPGGRTLILNTRTGQALEQAGIPRSQWNAINRTGDPLYERLLSEQLQRNNLTNNGIANPVLDRGRR